LVDTAAVPACVPVPCVSSGLVRPDSLTVPFTFADVSCGVSFRTSMMKSLASVTVLPSKSTA